MSTLSGLRSVVNTIKQLLLNGAKMVAPKLAIPAAPIDKAYDYSSNKKICVSSFDVNKIVRGIGNVPVTVSTNPM